MKVISFLTLTVPGITIPGRQQSVVCYVMMAVGLFRLSQPTWEIALLPGQS
ncbi:hypothetical protein LINPERHAP2_LOCUS19725 [Linum perenne]